MEGNKWDEVLDKLTKQLEFELRKTTRNEIIKFCVENKTTRKAAEDFLKKYKKLDGKCSTRASKKKDEGDETYRRGMYQDSIPLYTECIFGATKSDECLPLAYSNRAEVLLRRNCVSECLADVDIALDLLKGKRDIPEMLISMKVYCLSALEGTEKAREFLENYEEKCRNKEFCDKERKHIWIYSRTLAKENVGAGLPQLTGGENENFVSASKYLSVHFDENRGRHVVAAENIEPGDVLFVEKPFAHILFDKGCQNCLKSTQAPIPCFSCTDVSYCSKKCMDEFENVHSFECGFGELFKSVGIAHLSLRVVLTASHSFHDLQNISKNVLQPQYNNGAVCHRSKEYDSVYNLVHHSDKHESVDLFQYAMTALLLALHLKHNTKYFGGSPSDEDLEYVASRIWLHILQLICNGHATTRILTTGWEGPQVLRVTEVRCGTSIYPSASMMNHSCEPSIVHNFRDKWLVVRAAKPIRKGEEVFNCYGTHARRMNRAKRQEVLRKQYFFQCKCPECLSSYDVQEVLTAFRCTKCQGPAVRKVDNSRSTICLECGVGCDISREVSDKYDKFYALIKEGEFARCEDRISPLKIFLESWRLGREIFYKFHIDVAYAAKEVAGCLACSNDFERCVAFLKCCTRSVEARFGTFSVEYANEVKTLSEAVARYAAECKDKDEKSFRDTIRETAVHVEKANRIVNLLCGPESKESVEMKGIKNRIRRLY